LHIQVQASSQTKGLKPTVLQSRRALLELVFFAFFLYCSYPKALALVASGAVNVKPLVTHHFKLEQSLEAFETSRTGAGGAIKVMIHCNEDYQMK